LKLLQDYRSKLLRAYKADADYDQKIKELDLENQKNADEKKDRRIGMVIQVATTAVSGACLVENAESLDEI
jgi:hypothetical protein